MLADFLDFSSPEIKFELGNLVLNGDELKVLLVHIECALNLAPRIMDCFSAEEKKALALESIGALQRAGLLSARYRYH